MLTISKHKIHCPLCFHQGHNVRQCPIHLANSEWLKEPKLPIASTIEKLIHKSLLELKLMYKSENVGLTKQQLILNILNDPYIKCRLTFSNEFEMSFSLPTAVEGMDSDDQLPKEEAPKDTIFLVATKNVQSLFVKPKRLSVKRRRELEHEFENNVEAETHRVMEEVTRIPNDIIKQYILTTVYTELYKHTKNVIRNEMLPIHWERVQIEIAALAMDSGYRMPKTIESGDIAQQNSFQWMPAKTRCSICKLDYKTNECTFGSSCFHSCCFVCTEGLLNHTKNWTCPLCRADNSEIYLYIPV